MECECHHDIYVSIKLHQQLRKCMKHSNAYYNNSLSKNQEARHEEKDNPDSFLR